MFWKRFLTALVFLPLVIGAVVWGEMVGTAILIAVVAYIGMSEYLNLSGKGWGREEHWLICGWGSVIVLAFISDTPEMPGAALAMGSLVYVLYEGGKGELNQDTLKRISHVVGGWLLVAYFLGHAVSLRRYGFEPLLFLMILVMAGDTGAYLVGSRIGRHKLAPKLSPKKSIEGSVGGLLATMLVALYFAPKLGIRYDRGETLLLAVVVNVAAQAGDLAESLLKRAAGIKDSGTIFPGHGGVLDRVDSFLPTLPLYAAILTIFGG